jgi:hypothetical protein
VNKTQKKILALLIISAGFLLAQLAWAQGFGLNAVNDGLGNTLTASDPRVLAGRIINFSLGFLGVIAVGFIAYAGFLWLTSSGDEEKITTAKNILKNGVIGLVIILSSWAIASFIISRLVGTTNGTGTGCYEGETRSCGCGGSMMCASGSFGACLNSSCSSGVHPISCDASLDHKCTAFIDQLCASEDYCDHSDCACKPRGNLGDSCNGNSSNTAICSPDNSKCGEYLTCNPSSCTCYGPPVITEISPLGGFCQEDSNKPCVQDKDCSTTCNLTSPNGTVNNFVSILGKNFGEYSASSSAVIFTGVSRDGVAGLNPTQINPACINTWRDDEIIIAVPSGTISGPVTVKNKDELSDATNDTHGPQLPDFVVNNIKRPGLCYLDPTRGSLSAAVTYQGINLNAGTAYFGDYQNGVAGLKSSFNAVGLSGTSTIPNIRSGNSSSFVKNTAGQKSNYLRFIKDSEIGSGPFISSFTPTSGNAGQYVTIKGQGFGSMRGSSHVYFNTKEASYDFPEVCANSVWNNGQIVVKVPAGLTNGNYQVKISLSSTTIDTTNLNPSVFQFDKNAALKSSLCKIAPERGPAGTPVSLWGEYFGGLDSEALIQFYNNATSSGIVKQDGRASLLKTTVPQSAITGPVRVIKNNYWGNELNFSVGACTVDADCGAQICCPATTYKKGRCANAVSDCFMDVPTSVFEWNFSTGLGTSTVNPFTESCAGLAKYSGACKSGSACPSTPGTCSSAAGGGKIVGSCDNSCESVPGCSGNRCAYDASLDKCVAKTAICSLSQTVHYTVGTGASALTGSALAVCNPDKHWQITLASSCPNGWSRLSGDQCYNPDPAANCSLCDTGLNCAAVGGAGKCVSAQMCGNGATCQAKYNGLATDSCVKIEQPTCDCCCQIGKVGDCCENLSCTGSCGSDLGKTSGVTLGRCGGCANAGADQAAHDAACNCTGHSNQFCDLSNPDFKGGVCSDCSTLSGGDCTKHSSSCCLDSRNTATTTDDVCRGGSGEQISASNSDPGFGFCAYYKCQSGDSSKCAVDKPAVFGTYFGTSSCVTDCAKADPCSGVKDFTTCVGHDNCCFDAKAASGTPACRLGTQITNPLALKKVNGLTTSLLGSDHLSLNETSDVGYCAYYNCSNVNASTSVCNITKPVKDGFYNSTSTCSHYCSSKPSGAGSYCGGLATSTCDTSKCNIPGFACLLANGLFGTTPSDCGTCCCTPGPSDACSAINTKLKCEPGRGSCSGNNRGLCCGCSKDGDCGSASAVGCGSDTCCQARPSIVATLPKHLATQVCTNAAVQVDFDQPMAKDSFANNVLLLEEKTYGSGSCADGTFIGRANNVNSLLAANTSSGLFSWQTVKNLVAKLASYFGVSASADTPDPSKLYCAVPGTVAGEDNNNKTSLIFTPQGLLSPGSNYYFIVFGDTALDSQTGVLSSAKIGFNGPGYLDPATHQYVAGQTIAFNKLSYANSQIIKFSTIADTGNLGKGLCAIKEVKVNPESYLFKTTDNDLNEDDSNANAATFDRIADRDKVVSVAAYSDNGDLLHPVSKYFWTWDFVSDNYGVVSLSDSVRGLGTGKITGLANNKILVTANAGISDAETKVRAVVNMDHFSSSCNNAASCTCSGDSCPENCCNSSFQGRGFNAASDIYVFLCKNPWPPVDPSGNWSPWIDTCQGSLDSNCGNYNYKFYYCRDAGGTGTLDDLPAITNQAIIRGSGNNIVCSVSGGTCAQGAPSSLNSLCGPDNNGDGQPDGVCVWNVLKESYFFREAILSGADLVSVHDLQTSGTVQLNWRSKTAGVVSYKIYYLKSGSANNLAALEFKSADACVANGDINDCTANITGLTNKLAYVFQVTVISSNKTESALSNAVIATPTDAVPPAVPSLPSAQSANDGLKIIWKSNGGDTVAYRLWEGKQPRTYFNSPLVKDLSKTIPWEQISVGKYYFALSALDVSNNESDKSADLSCQVSLKTGCSKLTDSGCLLLNCCAGYQSCAKVLTLPNAAVSGSAVCNGALPGYDTASCALDRSYWFTPPADIMTDDLVVSGTPCLVKMNVDSNNQLDCSAGALTPSAQWFRGKIVVDGKLSCNPPTNNIYCAVTYQTAQGTTQTCRTDNNRCRYTSNCDTRYDWNGKCNILKTDRTAQ